MAASLLWGTIFPAERSWTEEKSQRMTELGTQAHQLGGARDSARRRPNMHGRSVSEIDSEYQKVTAELEQLRVEFEEQRDAPKRVSGVLRWLGIAIIVIGVVGNYASRGG
ncbi:hypothetical protein PLANPX_2391 [Lacipirellula parvula]|uniref:Uncharacterized protein n=2 Tax=Lacipirellula parvula TaxID=2650471 RepID=A0A5K7XIR1_9BACT|nr:hypothetical protein PLANPX_2391 [Lacipirellula parvula]